MDFNVFTTKFDESCYKDYQYPKGRPMSSALHLYVSAINHQKQCQLLLNLADDKSLDNKQKEIVFNAIKNQLTVFQVILKGGSMPKFKYHDHHVFI